MRLDREKENDELWIVRWKISEERMQIAIRVVAASVRNRDLRRPSLRRDRIMALSKLAVEKRFVENGDEHAGDYLRRGRAENTRAAWGINAARNPAVIFDCSYDVRIRQNATVRESGESAGHAD